MKHNRNWIIESANLYSEIFTRENMDLKSIPSNNLSKSLEFQGNEKFIDFKFI